MSKKETPNNNMLFIVIIVLLIIIAILAFFVGKNMGGTTVVNNGTATTNSMLPDDFAITVVSDTRCTDCQTEQFIGQIRQAPGLANVEIETVDFADAGVEEMLKEENINMLPAFIFSHNQGLDSQLSEYLQVLPSGKYSLSVGSAFNPFAERSERGNLMIAQDQVTELLEGLYISGKAEAPITWLEYSDVNCFYCKKMETDGTAAEVLSALPDDVNKATISYVSVGGAATQTAAEVLECIGSVGGSEQYIASFSQALSSGNNDKSALLKFAEENGVNTAEVETCIDNGDMKATITKKTELQDSNFGRGGTPRNILLNTQSGEYIVLGGAYPAADFKSSIELLK